uniref:Uncharacterized protein n=1 Tax=Setaria digitata TaxID=48799 RepID=A0A915PFH3_9BILA
MTLLVLKSRTIPFARITLPQKASHQSQQGATVGCSSRTSSNNSSTNINSCSSSSSSRSGGGGGSTDNSGHSSFCPGSSGKETPTTSSTEVRSIGYSNSIMYDQHPSIADSYSLVVASSLDTNNITNGTATSGKIDNDIESQLS